MIKSSNILICLVIALLAFGIIMVYSSSYIQAEQSLKFSDGYFFFKKQLVWIILSFIMMLLIKRIPYQFWSRIDWIILGITSFLLIAVLIPGIGQSYYGARRWIRFGSIGFQPSEFAKLGLVIFLASFISKDTERIKRFIKGFIPIALVIGAVSGLILLEPDVGTSAFIVLISVIILLAGRIRLLHTLPVILLSLPPLVYFIIHKFTYVQDRLIGFLHPTEYLMSKGYQVHQALIGLGSGGLAGVGLGLSKQKLFFLPQQHTDFIFAIIGEELGFIGAFVMILLFLGLLWSGRRVAMHALNRSGSGHAPDYFGFLLALGITLIISLQAVINIAVVTALLPTKGLSLPFISFGGSALFVLMAGIGILLNIATQSE